MRTKSNLYSTLAEMAYTTISALFRASVSLSFSALVDPLLLLWQLRALSTTAALAAGGFIHYTSLLAQILTSYGGNEFGEDNPCSAALATPPRKSTECLSLFLAPPNINQ